MPVLHLAILARLPLIREGLRVLLAAEPDFEIETFAPGDASTDDLIEDLLAFEASVLLLDIEVPELVGWELLNDLQRALPALTLLVLGDNPNDTRVARLLARGARGYLTRDASAQELADAIRAARSGSIVLTPALAAALLSQLDRANENARAADDSGGTGDLIEPLSERELDVLRLMTRGMSNKQIAAQLYITEHTVKFHIRAILGKLGASNRTEAVTLALQKGLVTL